MAKVKTNKSVAKRIKVTARGKLKRYRAGAGHLKSRKSPARIRRFRKKTDVAPGFRRQTRRLLGM
jgi:large subunit ribosomal protein L35